jgi:hypothetical protein
MQRMRFDARLATFASRPDECWKWPGCTKGGYGWTGYGGFAHRRAYALLVGPVPDGLDLDHLCRNRRCMNPKHLEPVTRQENILRGNHPTAITLRTGKCKAGHDLPNGGRCGVCLDAYQKSISGKRDRHRKRCDQAKTA